MRNLKKIISAALIITMLMTSTLVLFPAMSASAATPVVSGDGLKFEAGFGNVYSASSKLSTLPHTIEVTVDPKLNDNSGTGDGTYQEIFTTTGWSFPETDRPEKYNVNVPLSTVTLDLVHAGVNRDRGYGPSIRLFLFWCGDGQYDEGSVIFMGALDPDRSNSNKDEWMTGPVHLAVTIDEENQEVSLYVNGVKFNGTKHYEYLSSHGLGMNDAGLISLYKKLTVDTMPCHSLGGDFRKNASLDNHRYFRGKIYNASLFSDVRTVAEIESDMANVVPHGDAGLMTWYDTSKVTEYGTIPDDSGNGYVMKKGFGLASVSKGHVPADFDGDGETDEGAKPISTLAELEAIQQISTVNGKHVGKGGKYYLTANIFVPKGHKAGEALLYNSSTSRFTEDLYIDGCGYTIEFDKSNNVMATSPTKTAFGLLGHGSYDKDEPADLCIWNLNISGTIYDSGSNSNISSVMRTGTTGYTEFKNLVVSTDVRVDLCTSQIDAYDANKNLVTNIQGAQRSVAGIMAKNVANGKVLFEDVTFSGSVTSYDIMHDDGGKGDTSIFNASGKAKDFYQTGLGGFMGAVEDRSEITFKNCVNMGVINAKGQLGDDAGYNYDARGACVGGFIGKAEDTGLKLNFDGCTNMGNIIAINKDNVSPIVGGFVASVYAGKLTINNSKNLGVIRVHTVYSGNGSVSGFVGRSIAGDGVFITNSTNEGAIKVDGKIHASGFLGSVMWANADMDKVFNSGSITVESDRTASEASWENFAAGGIIAYLAHDSWTEDYLRLTNSGNSGDVHLVLPSGITSMKDGHVGGLVGAGNAVTSATITNCTNSGNVTYDGNYSAWGATGGIVGIFLGNKFSDQGARALNHTAKITSCVNTGKIDGAGHAGGIISGVKNFNSYSDTKTPGTYTLTIQGCKNYGDVSNKAYTYGSEYGTGGIAGDLCEGASANSAYYPYSVTYHILDCYNAGNVTSGGEYVGGIVGLIWNYRSRIPATVVTHTVERCINAGKVLSTPYPGTFVQNSSGKWSITTNTNNIATRCGDSWGAFAGGIVGYFEAMFAADGTTLMSKLQITDCINIGEVTMDKTNGTLNADTGVYTANEYRHGYGTFPIINCCENRAYSTDANHTPQKYEKNADGSFKMNGNNYVMTAIAINITDSEGQKGQYSMPHINGGPGSATAKSGNLFIAATMTGRQKSESAGNTHHTGGYWGCQVSGGADNDHWHEFSDSKTGTQIQDVIMNGAAYKDNAYYTVADKGLLYLVAGGATQNKLDAYTELMEVLTLCYTYEENNYTTETWAPFFRARAEAQKPDARDYTIEGLKNLTNKLLAAKNNLVPPDYTSLISAINTTTVPDERLHNFEVFSRKNYQDALASAKKALTSRSQTAIDAATKALEVAHTNLKTTTPAYIIVIPESIPSETAQQVSVMTSEFHDGCSLDVTVAYDGEMVEKTEETIQYKIRKIRDGNTDVDVEVKTNETPILQFGKAENATKSATLIVKEADMAFSNKYVAGEYLDKATFNVSLYIEDIKH